MDALRLEMRLGGALGSSTMVAGAVTGDVLAVVVDPATMTVVQTKVASRIARQLGLTAQDELSAAGVTLSSKTEVRSADNKHHLGNLGRLWVDRASNHLTHILINKDRSFHVLEITHIAKLDGQHITLAATVRDLQSIPVYRDDAAIAGDVGAAIETTLLDPRARRSIHARVEDGQVDLSGTLYSEEQFNALFAAIKGTLGVRTVRSDVIIEVELADAVISAIDQLRAKGDLAATDIVDVLSEHQILYLQGQVSTPKVKAAVERAALSVAGVRLVVNNLSTLTPEKNERADPASPETHLR